MYTVIECGYGRHDVFQSGAYQSWWTENQDDDIPSEAIFSRQMQERGLKKRRTKANYVYDDVMVVRANSYDQPYNF
jgi:hypothetical protein